MTLQSLDCWYERLSGSTADTPIEAFYAKHFDNEYMAERFQSMTINPDNATPRQQIACQNAILGGTPSALVEGSWDA